MSEKGRVILDSLEFDEIAEDDVATEGESDSVVTAPDLKVSLEERQTPEKAEKARELR